MYERFTDGARKTMQLANQEAQRFNHEYIGTVHILLGLIEEGSVAATFHRFNVDLKRVRTEVEKIVQSGFDTIVMGKLPQTPRAKKVIEYEMEEARNLNHNYVGIEHLLLGLLREQEGVAAQVLMNLGMKLETTLGLLFIGDEPTGVELPEVTAEQGAAYRDLLLEWVELGYIADKLVWCVKVHEWESKVINTLRATKG